MKMGIHRIEKARTRERRNGKERKEKEEGSVES